jgi:hypothetical protein
MNRFLALSWLFRKYHNVPINCGSLVTGLYIGTYTTFGKNMGINYIQTQYHLERRRQYYSNQSLQNVGCA